MLRWITCLLLFLAAVSAGYAQTDTVVTASGIKYVVLQKGQGNHPEPGARVAVHYTGKFRSGHIFDTSALSGKPLKVRLGRGEVIPGWEQILPLMQTGTRLVMVVPALLAYGAKGLLSDDDTYKIPPNTDLLFELEMVAIKQ